MKTCKDLHIVPCPFCDKTMVDTNCWVIQWEIDITYNNLGTEWCISQFLSLLQIEETKYSYILYFLEAVKLSKPELIEKFNKLQSLI
jgi:hypothetical protein